MWGAYAAGESWDCSGMRRHGRAYVCLRSCFSFCVPRIASIETCFCGLQRCVSRRNPPRHPMSMFPSRPSDCPTEVRTRGGVRWQCAPDARWNSPDAVTGRQTTESERELRESSRSLCPVWSVSDSVRESPRVRRATRGRSAAGRRPPREQRVARGSHVFTLTRSKISKQESF